MPNETAHWEFYNWKSFLSTMEGIIQDSDMVAIEEWVERIIEKQVLIGSFYTRC
ncbi:hypothetical protein [Bacillus sp. LL01]|uniref:hypothetical protein n=1 Tax=Bacillus sp. LL01 TaxID=1665556 RepID=UPI0012FEFDF7|nr:hypothetical protein [Bacillus sp. LL01]